MGSIFHKGVKYGGSYSDKEGWNTLNTSVQYKRKNGYVSVRINASGLTSDAWNDLGYLPSGYWPEGVCYYIVSNGGSGSYTCMVSVNSANGQLRAKPLSGTGAYGLVIYPLAD